METTWQCTQNEIAREATEPNVQIDQKTWENPNNLLFYLRWNNFQSNLTKVFDKLLQSESFVDVTLACDGHSIKAHKVVLSACSPYFESLFSQNPCQHPIVIMRDVTWPQLRAIVEFMYKGEINVAQEHLAPLLMVAEMLKIRGLTEVSTDQEKNVIDCPVTISNELPTQNDILPDNNPPPKIKRKRNSSNTSTTSETCTTTYISLAANNSQLTSTKITTSNKSSTTLQPLTNVPFVTYSRTSTYPDTDSPDKKIKDEPPIKQIKINATSSSSDFTPVRNNNKAITWTQDQLQEAIQAVVTQKMRFTQASATYGIPKGTLYDNILGKTKRMLVLDEAGLSPEEEKIVLEFCCDVSVTPYNRRTKRSLASVLEFVERLRRTRDPEFAFSGLAGYRWWWAFCKKHSIVSLYYDNNKTPSNSLKDRHCKVETVL